MAELERDKRESELLNGITFSHDGMEAANLAALWRLASMYSRSDIVPEQFRGKPENCLIALQMAQRCRIDPFAFMQASYVVHGRPGIEAKLAIAMLNSSGKIAGRVRYEFDGEGDKRSCTACVKDKESGEEIRLKLDWKTVEAEGWNKKNGSKWLTIPEQMFRYRSAVFLIRTHYPEVMMGLSTTDEMEDEPGPVPAGPPVGKGIKLGRNGNVARKESEHGSTAANGNGSGQEAGPVSAPTAETARVADVPEAGASSDAQGQDQEVDADDAMARRDALDDYVGRINASDHQDDIAAILSEAFKQSKWLGKDVERVRNAAANRQAQIASARGPAVAGKVGKKNYEV